MGGTDSRYFLLQVLTQKIHRNPGCASPKGRTYEEKKKKILRTLANETKKTLFFLSFLFVFSKVGKLATATCPHV